MTTKTYPPRRWWCTLRVAVELGVDPSTVRYWVGRGWLTPRLCHHPTGRGAPGFYFDPAEVLAESLGERRRGQDKETRHLP